MNSVQQVPDDTSLLTLMIEDNVSAAYVFHPSERWKRYSDLFVRYLYEVGLKDFRRTYGEPGSAAGVLSSFGAVDINPIEEDFYNLFHQAASSFLGNTGVHISNIGANRVGNPEGFKIDGKFYTISWLNFYCRYAYVSKFFDFKDQCIVELGSGSGKQAELLKRAHPELTIILFDLPAQLYVCHQYLKSVFDEEHVVDYRESRLFSSFDDIKKGKINILPNWLFPVLKNEPVDLFWNAASIQEMSLTSARMFLDHISASKNLYLMHNVKFFKEPCYTLKRGVVDEVGSYGFIEVDRSLAVKSSGSDWIYRDSFWAKC